MFISYKMNLYSMQSKVRSHNVLSLNKTSEPDLNECLVLTAACEWCGGAYSSGGLAGEPKGLKAVSTMFLDLHSSIISDCTR